MALARELRRRIRSSDGVVALLAVAMFLLLMCFAGRYGFSSDELYFMACAQHPAWGYVDLPPLLPWLTFVVRHTLGSSLYAAHLYPALAFAVAIVLSARLARELGGGPRSAIIAAVLASVSPVMLAVGHVLSANALDMPLWIACVLVLVRIERTNNPRLWLLFGALAGIALLHKYSLAFYLAAMLVGVLLTPWRRWLVDPWSWAGAALAVVIVLPNLIWQANRDFPFLQVLHNIAAHHRNVVLPPLQFVFAQALLANIFGFAFVLAGAVYLFTPPARRFRALGWSYLAFMLLMFALHAKDYYLGPIYPIMFAAGAVAAERWWAGPWGRRLVTAYLAVAAIFCALLLPTFVPVFPIDTFAAYYQKLPLRRTEAEHNVHSSLPDFYSTDFGWRELAALVARYYNSLPPEERRKTAIYADFYGEAGAIDLFGPALGLPTAISGHHSYWYWGPRGSTGDSVILIGYDRGAMRHHCASFTLVGTPHARWARPDQLTPVYHCRGLDYDLTKEWRRFRHFD
jgi:Dolichyl-phosphate-mannose-protein mannosyltransferase